MPAIPEVFKISGVQVDKQKGDAKLPCNIIAVFQAYVNTYQAADGR